MRYQRDDRHHDEKNRAGDAPSSLLQPIQSAQRLLEIAIHGTPPSYQRDNFAADSDLDRLTPGLPITPRFKLAF
jgi:hypothetical protein